MTGSEPSWPIDQRTRQARALRRVCDERARVASHRDNAVWRRDQAPKELEDLGPIGRRTHRGQRRSAEDRIISCTDEVARHEEQIDRDRRAG